MGLRFQVTKLFSIIKQLKNGRENYTSSPWNFNGKLIKCEWTSNPSSEFTTKRCEEQVVIAESYEESSAKAGMAKLNMSAVKCYFRFRAFLTFSNGQKIQRKGIQNLRKVL